MWKHIQKWNSIYSSQNFSRECRYYEIFKRVFVTVSTSCKKEDNLCLHAICQHAAALFNLNLRLWIERLDVSGRFHVRIFLKFACITIIHKSTLKRWKNVILQHIFYERKKSKICKSKCPKLRANFVKTNSSNFEHLDWLMANNKTNFAISQSKCSIWEIGFYKIDLEMILTHKKSKLSYHK